MLIIILLAIGFWFGWLWRDASAASEMVELELEHQRYINELLDNLLGPHDGGGLTKRNPPPQEPVKAIAKAAGAGR